jgi:hypothetical protein
MSLTGTYRLYWTTLRDNDMGTIVSIQVDQNEANRVLRCIANEKALDKEFTSLHPDVLLQHFINSHTLDLWLSPREKKGQSYWLRLKQHGEVSFSGDKKAAAAFRNCMYACRRIDPEGNNFTLNWTKQLSDGFYQIKVTARRI